MDPTKQRWIRNTIGVFAAFVLLFELLSLWSFTATYFARNQSVLFGFPIVGTFRLPPILLLGGLGVLVAAAVHYSERDDIPGAIEAAVRETGEVVGLLESSDITVRGAITYDEVRWVSAYTTDGRIIDVHRQCPRCRRDLTPAHVPANALRATPTPADGDSDEQSSASAQAVRPASLLASIVQYSSSTASGAGNESELVEAQACPHCEFAVAGTSAEASNREAVRDLFQNHYTQMAGPNGVPAASLEQQARDRLDRTPTPSDVWDEYVIQVGPPEAARINVVEETDELTHMPVESYPALAELKSRADGIDRALEMLVPDSLKPVFNRHFYSAYLAERQELLQERQRVRDELVRCLRDLDRQVGDQLHTAQVCAENRNRPATSLNLLQEAVSHTQRTLRELNANIDTDFLTHGEQHRLAALRRRLATTAEYLETTAEFRDRRETLEARIRAFETQYDPYRDCDRYLPTVEQEALCTDAREIAATIQQTMTDYPLSRLPSADEEWLLDQQSTFKNYCDWLPNYNEGTDDRRGFVDRQTEAYADLLQTEHGPLNDKQQAAVVRNDYHNIVDASAGTGKTLTLTKRFEYLCARGVDPADILVVTLTKPARTKIENEILAAVDGVRRPWDLNVYNFHGLASEIITNAATDDVLTNWDRDEMRRAYVNGFIDGESEFAERHPDEYTEFRHQAEQYCESAGVKEFPAGKLEEFIREARNFARSPTAIEDELTEANRDQYHFGLAATAVLRAYLDRAETQLAPVDELDKLETATRIIQSHPDAFADRYQHILVDEFQDVAQPSVDLIKALLSASETDTRLFVVGDDWQSIYGFRGSNPSFFTDFETEFESVTRTTLEINYRCPPSVVNASRELMADNYHTAKHATPAAEEPDTQPYLYRIDGFYKHQLVQTTVEIIEQRLAANPEFDADDVLILSRNVNGNPHVTRIRDRLTDAGYTVTDRNDAPGITIQPIHSSKGEDEHLVFLVHATDEGSNGLPSKDHPDPLVDPAKANTVSSYHEERRLCYVALTRTAAELHVFAKRDEESPFIAEIAEHFCQYSVNGPDTVTGTILEVAKQNKRHVGTIDCEEFDRQIDFAIPEWEFTDEAYTTLTNTLQEGTRYRFENVVDATGSQFEDIELTSESTIEAIDLNQAPSHPVEDD